MWRVKLSRWRTAGLLLLAAVAALLGFPSRAPQNSASDRPRLTATAPPHAPPSTPAGPALLSQRVSTSAHGQPGGLSGLRALAADLAGQLQRAGGGSSAYVFDVSTGRTLFVRAGDVSRAPASLQKLYTSVTALERLGASARLATTVLGAGSLGPRGVWHGSLYLRGGGDPTLGAPGFDTAAYGQGANISQLAGGLKAAGIRHVTGSVIGDESYFDERRGGPASGYRPDLPDLGGELSALVFDHGQVGRSGAERGPAGYAALALAGALRGVRVSVRGHSGVGRAPAAARELAQVQSPPLSSLLGLMNAPSDNFFAELLVKQLGARVGGAGTTAAGARVIAATLAGYGAGARVIDGSGLSSADATTAREMVSVLADLQPTAAAVLRGSLAQPGRRGTLAGRMRATRAAGHCQAKTGSLLTVSNIAGYCQGADGHTLAFAFLMDGADESLAHRLQDHMVITLADFKGGA
jgi:D-alanyl-D-alanine carboxypeptidase/D-alanyl-D-alanine-endopeptidase (penicillin-binding protein 4)